MSNLTSLTVDASGKITTPGSFSTLDNFAGTAGSPSAEILTVQGIVQGSTISGFQNPTVTASTYAANKCIGGLMTFANILPATFGGTLESIRLKFKGSVQTVGFAVAIFTSVSDSGGTTLTDTNTAAVAAADVNKLIGQFYLSVSQSAFGTTGFTTYNLDGIACALQGTSTSLWAAVVPINTTAALGSTSDMFLELGVLQG